MPPDRRNHRGANARDPDLFSERHHADLQRAVNEFSWLLTRGYPESAALKLVGDRYALKARQRIAVMRCGCSDQAVLHTTGISITPDLCTGHPVGIDGYNLLITIESALSGGLVLIGRDGRYRDMASVHGSYRTVQETGEALELILEQVERLQPSRVDFYLDRPVSNSGRLKKRIAGVAPSWNIELPHSPDRLLKKYKGTVVTSDSAVLSHCTCTLDMAGVIIREHVPDSWILNLRPGSPPLFYVDGKRS